MATSVAVLARNAALNAINTYCAAAGKVIIYDGTVPATADTALGAQNVLATLTTHAVSTFNAAAAGSMAADVIADVTASATGTATFFRLYKADGVTVVLQGAVGTSGAECIVNTTAFVSGMSVHVSSLTLAQA